MLPSLFEEANMERVNATTTLAGAAPAIRGISLIQKAGHETIRELDMMIEQAHRIRYNLHGPAQSPSGAKPNAESPEDLKSIHSVIHNRICELRDAMNEIESGV